MKNLLWGVAAVALIAAGSARAGDIVFKPIDTNRYVVQPSKTAAGLASRTIDIVGQTAAGSLEQNGYVKLINNLFSKKIIVPHTQSGRSQLPSPNLYPSTQYKSYNTPVMPSVQYRR